MVRCGLRDTDVETYDHQDKRRNRPVFAVFFEVDDHDRDRGSRTYSELLGKQASEDLPSNSAAAAN